MDYEYMLTTADAVTEDAKVEIAKHNFAALLERELGMTPVEKRTDIGPGNYRLAVLPYFVTVFCHLDDTVFVDSVIRMFNGESEFREKYGLPPKWEVNRMQVGVGMSARRRVGAGFGANKWRRNPAHKGLEISFGGKPSEEIRATIKAAGFRWNQKDGVWYCPEKKVEDINKLAQAIGVTQAEDAA